MIETHNSVNFENTALEKAIKDDFGFEVKIINKVKERPSSNQVFKALIEGTTVFIIIEKDSERSLGATVLGHKILVERGIPVPKVISYLEKPKSIGLETAIIDSADGVPMPEAHLPKEQKNKIYELLGEWLKKIHEIKLDGFGKLKIRNGKLQGKFASPKEYWESNKNNGHKAIDFLFDKELITEEEAKKIRGVYSEIEALEFGQASFLHRDLHQDHVFVKDGNISGIIDFASSMAGDPRQDIAMSLVFQNKEEREYFKKGYGELANDPMVQKYMMIIALHKILSRFKRKNEIDEKMLKLIKIF